MRAAIYARYSSENQRPESIEDQISSCRRFAKERKHTVDQAHIYTDQAASGAREDRPGLAALRAAAVDGEFRVVLIDDLSRLARNTLLLLSVLEELRFQGVRVVSVADGLDTNDPEATVGIQVRGVFNELQLMDLRKKTLRGQIGQKQRGFIVGEATYGYRSVAVGDVRMDKKGRPRPEGYKMTVDPREAGVILGVFKEFVAGCSESQIVRRMNADGVPGRRRTKNGWSPATVHRMLRNEKYIGHWVWNRTETRRDPRTGRRRQFPKPESEWFITEDQSLRIVPRKLWERTQRRLASVRKVWPGGRGRRGFQGQRGSHVAHYPKDLLSGAMSCASCGSTIAKVSGKSGGYYGCLGARKAACDNRLLVRRALVERVVLAAVRDRLTQPENLAYIFAKLEQAVANASTATPEAIRLTKAEFDAEQRRVANFVEFVAEGRGSRALVEALTASEKRLENLRADLVELRRSQRDVFSLPPKEWVAERIETLQSVLERRTERSGLLLRKLLGPIKMQPVTPDVGRPYYRARSNLDALAIMENDPDSPDPEPGSTSLQWWRRRESNPRPKVRLRRILHACPLFKSHHRCRRVAEITGDQPRLVSSSRVGAARDDQPTKWHLSSLRGRARGRRAT